MSQPKEIFVKTDRCVGCLSCKIACAVEHSKSKTLFGAISEHPVPKSRVYVQWVEPDGKVPLVCRHCEDAPCMYACISGAISRDENGVVITDTDKCIGCWTCRKDHSSDSLRQFKDLNQCLWVEDSHISACLAVTQALRKLSHSCSPFLMPNPAL